MSGGSHQCSLCVNRVPCERTFCNVTHVCKPCAKNIRANVRTHGKTLQELKTFKCQHPTNCWNSAKKVSVSKTRTDSRGRRASSRTNRAAFPIRRFSSWLESGGWNQPATRNVPTTILWLYFQWKRTLLQGEITNSDCYVTGGQRHINHRFEFVLGTPLTSVIL